MTASDPAAIGESEVDAPAQGGQDRWFLATKFFLAAACLAFFLRTFWMEPYAIPTPSMLPTLMPGDYVLAAKHAYGYSRHALPFSPSLFNGRLLAKPVQRGDLVVFKLPRDRRSNFIKRVIGLPGDHIQVRHGQIFINDQPVARQAISPVIMPREVLGPCTEQIADGMCRVARYEETLPNGRRYIVWDAVIDSDVDNSRVFQVPDEHYFMLGDNRDHSQDSRRPQSVGVGYVPAENLVGRAERIFFSLEPGRRGLWPWQWFAGWRSSRFLSALDNVND